MILINWLKRIRAGSGFCGFSASSWNKVCNVLETIEGIGCTINKTHSGNGWTVVVDGKSSDAPYPEGLTPVGGGDAAGDSVVVAKITGGTTLTGYDVTCYPAYPATTGSYAGKMAVPEIALGTELPVNTYIIAHKKAVEIMGGTPA